MSCELRMKITLEKERRWLYLAVALASITLLVLAYKYARPAVPRVVTMSTGGAGGAYEAFALRYAAALAEAGITLKLLPSRGAVENLERLRDAKSGVDLAFLQNGLVSRESTEGGALESLGSLFYEPAFVFYRPQPDFTNVSRIAQLRGRRVGIGPEGSGSRVLALALLGINGIDSSNTTLQALSADDAARALREGSLDAAFIVANVSAPVVQSLFRDTSVRASNLELAETYSRRLGFVNPIVIERGVVDVASQIPTQSVRTVATTSSMVAREDLHPAVVYLLVRASKRLHEGGGLISQPGEFPTFGKQQDFPPSAEAERLYKEGTPLLYRYLPFNVANFLSRAIVFVVPLFAIALSLSDWIPKLIGIRARAKVYRHYKTLRLIDQSVGTARTRADLDALSAQLNALDATVGQLNIPHTYGNEQFGIRDHMDLVRVRIERKRGDLANAEGAVG